MEQLESSCENKKLAQHTKVEEKRSEKRHYC